MLNALQGRRGPTSQSSSMSARSSARMLADEAGDGMELEHMLSDVNVNSATGTAVINTNYRPYNSYA